MYGLINEEMDFHTIKIRRAFWRSIPFWKIFGNRRRLVWRSYSWFDMTRLYTQWLQAYQQKDRLSHLIQNLTSLSAFGSILKIFEGIDVGWCEGSTSGWIRQDYVHDGYTRINGKIDSHITWNSTSLSAFGSILKFFEGTVSVNVRVVLLVGYDKTMYTRVNEKINSHITKIRRAFRRSVPFLKDFWEPISVDVWVVLLVGYVKTMYTMVTRASTER